MTRAVQIAELGDQNVFTVDGDNSRIGIGTTNPQALLQVGTGVSVYGNSGIVSAKTYYGSGAELTGITGGATLSAASGSQRVVVTSLTSGSMTAAGTDADFAWNSTTNTLSATNISVSGTLTYEDVTNVDSVGLITARSGLRVVGGGATITGITTSLSGLNIVGGGLTVTGVSTFFDTVRVGSAITLGASSGIITATKFVGSGEGLTGVASTDNIITSTASTFANINSTGIVTAVSFSGDGSGLSGVGGQLDITSSLFT